MREIQCADCGVTVQTKAHNRKVCTECGQERERQRRRGWWERNPTYAKDRYYGDLERHRAAAREYQRLRDPEERKAEARNRYYGDREKALAVAKRYRDANKAKVAKYQREWRQRNIATVREYEREYRETHREQRRADFQRWRSRLHGAEGSFSPSEFTALCGAAGWRCAYCGTETRSLTADHMVPLSRGGSNAIDNIAPACKSCNSSKGAKTPEEFAAWLAEVK